MNETNADSMFVDGRAVQIDGERNVLEIIRKAGVDLPTFCYHSDLSIYGACRLCLVAVDGRGIQGACSLPPERGLRVRTNTEELRNVRRVTVELLLANHDQKCPTCPKSGDCQLQALAHKLGIRNVRFKPVLKPSEIDISSPSLVRDPNRCVLCGDCVRVCAETQGIGAIDFAHRGADVVVAPGFGRTLAEGECVNCGQCAAVCPTGALTVRSDVEAVWRALGDPSKRVVAQIAPAVRVAIGESFGLEPGAQATLECVAALKAMGFAEVYDTAFAADLTVFEEATEFLARKGTGKNLPQFTSCCPAWVKFAEQSFPELLPNLSTCRSPQQMLGALVKGCGPDRREDPHAETVVVSIMPCTAKKFEAKRPEMSREGVPDVDHVITTQELARMIQESGLRFRELSPESFDLPLGYKSGAGVLFGASGGVTEAVLRYAAAKVSPNELGPVDFHAVRGEAGLREADVALGGTTLHLALVHGLANARRIAERVRGGDRRWDLIEVMACPGGCIGGAGQPVARNPTMARRKRSLGIYANDKQLDIHRSQDNPFVCRLYEERLGTIGGHEAHELLHTHYQSRRRVPDQEIDLASALRRDRTVVRVCVGTNCFLRGSQTILTALLRDVAARGLDDEVDVRASFCFENCAGGPSVSVGEKLLSGASLTRVREEIDRALCARGVEPLQVDLELEKSEVAVTERR